MKKIIIFLFSIVIPILSYSQGMNNTWLLGNDPGWPNIGRLVFDTNSYQLLTEQRKMAFKGTQATISDYQGNFLMSSNGVWIANANNDTMMNGTGLNPGPFVNNSLNGLVIDAGNMFLPFPDDSLQYILIHQTGTTNLQNFPSFELFYSLIDITLDNNLGGVTFKNNIIIQDTLSWGIAACKHGNGRDWWVITQKDSSDKLFIILFTPNGIESISTQNLGYSPFSINSSQTTFSQDGAKFITSNYDNSVSRNSSLIISDFDRCSGTFSNTQHLQLTSGEYLWGLAFSPSGEFVYACNSLYVFQIKTSTLFVDTVATFDGFISGFPPNCCATSFWTPYLAANGKIYITSGNSVQHLHEMNSPDSAGVSCNVQQHNIALGNYFHLRAVPNHPNYYLGALTGSPCDSLTGVKEATHDFRFAIAPNPSTGKFRILYLLPQGQKGMLEIFDINGRIIYQMNLPPWSTMQLVELPDIISAGIYNCVVSSGMERANKKIVLLD